MEVITLKQPFYENRLFKYSQKLCLYKIMNILSCETLKMLLKKRELPSKSS